VLGAAFALGLGIVLLIPVVIALARIEEIAAIASGQAARLIAAALPAPTAFAEGVDPLPAYREPPEMLKATLDAVARLTTRASNVSSSSTTRPIRHSGADRGSLPDLEQRFKFINEKPERLQAGALRLALAHTAADAEIIGVIDADYVFIQTG